MTYTVKVLDIHCWPDVVSLFSTNRECGLCFCMSHRVKPENEVLGEDAKQALHKLIESDKVCSILAYKDNLCVGWCAVDPLEEQPGHDYSFWKDAQLHPDTWSIHCLFVHPNHRGKGLSNILIKKAIDTAKDKGAKKIIAFPIPPKMRKHFPQHDSEFSGRFSSFTKAGFKPTARINDFYEVVSLEVL